MCTNVAKTKAKIVTSVYFQQCPGFMQARLAKVDAAHPRLAEMVRHMLQRNPENRDSMEGYISIWSVELFSPYMEPLHRILMPIMTWSKDHAVLHIKTCFSAALQHVLPSVSKKRSSAVTTVQGKKSDQGTPKIGLKTEPICGAPEHRLAESDHGQSKSGASSVSCTLLLPIIVLLLPILFLSNFWATFVAEVQQPDMHARPLAPITEFKAKKDMGSISMRVLPHNLTALQAADRGGGENESAACPAEEGSRVTTDGERIWRCTRASTESSSTLESASADGSSTGKGPHASSVNSTSPVDAARPIAIPGTAAYWAALGEQFLRQALQGPDAPGGLGLLVCVLCCLQRGARSQEARWQAASMLLQVRAHSPETVGSSDSLTNAR
jgi:hypothetical protein